MDFDITRIKKGHILIENRDILIAVNELRDLLGLSTRTKFRWLEKVNAENKFIKPLRFNGKFNSKTMMLTSDGVKSFLAEGYDVSVTPAYDILEYLDQMLVDYIADQLQNPIAGKKGGELAPGACIYLFRIKDNLYKVGETDHIANRLTAHRTEFKYEGRVKIFRCSDKTASQWVEATLLNELDLLGLMIKYPYRTDPTKFHTEVFSYDENIEELWHRIDELIIQYAIHHANDEEIGIKLQQINDKREDLGHKKVADAAIINATKHQAKIDEKILDGVDQLRIDLDRAHMKIEELQLRTPAIEVREIVIKRPQNRPDANLEMDINTLVIFVQHNFEASPGATIGKDTLSLRLSDTVYGEYITSANPEIKREFYCNLMSCLETTLGIDPRSPVGGKGNKDTVYNCKVICLPIDDFVNAKCNRVEKTSENTESFKAAYREYAREQNRFRFVQEFPKAMIAAGYRQKDNNRRGGKRYCGVHIRDTSIKRFIEQQCDTTDVTKYCELNKFETSYLAFCMSEQIPLNMAYDKNSLKFIIEDMGYPIISFNNGCINVQGLTIIGNEYNRKKKLPVNKRQMIIEPKDNILPPE